MLKFARILPALSLALLLSACANSYAPPPQQKSLYERLGEKPAIEAVVNDFVGNVAADPRINYFFVHTDIDRLKTLLVEQICQVSGGPCTYTGRSMKVAHAGMGIQDSHFNALVEDMVKSLDKFKVGEQEKNELLTALASMKGDIVAH